MATLRKRREMWYARVRWYDVDNREVEKQVPLRTQSKTTARIRLDDVNKEEPNIKAGLKFNFPWLNDGQITSVRQFAVRDAISKWLRDRRSNGIRPSTINRNQYSMASFMAMRSKR